MTDSDTTIPSSETPSAETTTLRDEGSVQAGGEQGPVTAGPPAGPATEPSVEERFAELQKTADRTKGQLLRVAADFDNFRKRAARDLEQARRRVRQQTIMDLVPTFDNLERATGAASSSSDAQSMAQGLALVHKQFLDTLGRMGVVRVEAVGQPFDPMVHESVHQQPSSEHAAGVVIEQVQAGYKMGETLMRPAMVVVSSGPASPTATGQDAELTGSTEPGTEPEGSA